MQTVVVDFVCTPFKRDADCIGSNSGLIYLQTFLACDHAFIFPASSSRVINSRVSCLSEDEAMVYLTTALSRYVTDSCPQMYYTCSYKMNPAKLAGDLILGQNQWPSRAVYVLGQRRSCPEGSCPSFSLLSLWNGFEFSLGDS